MISISYSYLPNMKIIEIETYNSITLSYSNNNNNKKKNKKIKNKKRNYKAKVF